MDERLQVLFIADSETDLLPILQALHSGGLHPIWEWVSTAESLYQAITGRFWDVIISNYSLLELNVLTSLAVVESSQLKIPLIVISDVGGERLAVEMIKAGAFDYLVKSDLPLLPDIVQQATKGLEKRLDYQQTCLNSLARETNYRSIYRNAAQGIYQSTPDGQYLIANQALAELYGYADPEALISQLNTSKHQIYVAPERRDEFEKIIAGQGYIFGFESEVYRRDGTTLWVSESGRLVLDEQGQPSYYEGFVRDISDRKRLEAVRRLSAARTKTFFEQAAVGLVESNTQTGQLTLVNPYFCKMLGYSRAELLTMTVQEISHPDDVITSIETVQQLCSRQLESYKFEKRYIRKDGSSFWAEITLNFVNHDGSERKRCLAIVQDISDRKQAQKEREKFFNLSLDLLCIASLDGYFLEVNPAWEGVLGYKTEELVHLPFINLVHAEDRAATIKTFNCLKDGDIVLDFENRYLCKDGSYRWLAWRSIPDTESGIVYGIARDITNLKRTQQHLQHLNKALEVKIEERTKALAMTQSAVDFAADCVYLIRSDGSFHYVNDTALTKLGYDRAEFQTLKVWDINATVSPDDWNNIWQTIKQQSALTLESFHATKAGQVFPIEINTKYFDFDGEEYCFSFVRDISQRKQLDTERKLAEATIQKENKFRQQILENMAEGLCVCHQIHESPFIRHTVWNRKMKLITGYSLKEINHLGVIPGLVPETMPQAAYVNSFMQQLQTGKAPTTIEAQIQRKDGQHRTVAISISVLSDFEGQFTVLAMMQDITERKQSQQSARLLANVVESTDDAIITKNLDGIITSWNPAAVDLFGYTEAEAIGQSIGILFPPDRLTLEPQILENLRQGKRINNFETINLHKNGTPIDVSATISPLRDETGKVVGASKIVRDITRRKQAELELRLTNEELMQATRLKDEFLANMSHELRTPLNTILGMTESLQEQVFGQIHEQQIKPLQMIRRSGNHLLELINEVLDVAKIESGQMTLDLKPTAVIPLCQSSLDFIQQQANKKNIQIEALFPFYAPTVRLDERRIRQVLLNLLSNAVKFTPEGGRVTLAVSLHNPASSKAQLLRIAVSDTGIGIAREDINKLFQPFIQIDSALNRQYSGTGLGLALVKRLVDLHGGDVRVTSKIEQGSCFTVDLPCINTSNDDPAKPLQTFSKDDGDHPTSSGISLIILAEDKAANIITIMSYLRAKGYRIRPAANRQEVITLSQSEVPDLILMDSQMPGPHNLDVIQQIRLVPALITVPVIILTDPVMHSEQEQYQKQYQTIGVYQHRKQPFKLTQLIDTIQQLLH
ncbi:multi-sensor hybrid histidine kinase [Leptolyngbya sp. Heron Island J]|uniref:PAS domain S-box protein n=1 Tax=Leptolyngbya sp. Heron Island J TaxID=1385935 RepID=UPI0003B94BB7|nr:PAS domain S-box protein [Leptolyngbya sp. Heron Island J]ESA38784.1 multi-sensor hybrid histidine kinase [Leptolyngbya sp. Heron Island J]